MKRLTFKKWFEHFKPDEETTTIEVTGYTQIVECEDVPYPKSYYYLVGEAVDKLAYYEDLEEKLEKVYGKCEGLLETAVNSLVRHEGVEIGTPAKVRIPCKPGDTLWILISGTKEIKSFKVARIMLGRFHDSITMTDKSVFTIWGKYWDEYFNRFAFKTKEEAEQALARMEKEND